MSEQGRYELVSGHFPANKRFPTVAAALAYLNNGPPRESWLIWDTVIRRTVLTATEWREGQRRPPPV